MRTIMPDTWAVEADMTAKELRPMLPGGDDEDAYPDRLIDEVAAAATLYVETRVGAWLAPRDRIEDLHEDWGRPGDPRCHLPTSARPLAGQRVGPENMAGVVVSYLDEDGATQELAAGRWRIAWTGADGPGVFIDSNPPALYRIEPYPIAIRYGWRPPRLPDDIREAVGLVFRAMATARAAGESWNEQELEGLSALLAGRRGPRAAFV